MGKVIYKYKLDNPNETRIIMPEATEILCVQMQFGSPVIWAMVDPDLPPQERVFEILGTGKAMEGNVNRKYIGTFQMGEGRLVFHVFEELKN